MQPDILFIHPNSSKKIYQDLSKDHSAIEPPIWAGMLNNACLKAGHRSEILDCEVLRLSYEKSVQKIDEINPRIWMSIKNVAHDGSPIVISSHLRQS